METKTNYSYIDRISAELTNAAFDHVTARDNASAKAELLVEEAMTTYKEELAGAIVTLADARATVDEYKAIIAKLDEIIAATNFGQQRSAAVATLEIAKASAESTDATTREMVLAQFVIDADKHPHPAVTVKEVKVVCVSFEQDAIAWGIEKGANFVKQTLLKAQLKKALELFPFIPGAALITQPCSTISKDLSKYIIPAGVATGEPTTASICPDCGATVPDDAANCPQCGEAYPF